MLSNNLHFRHDDTTSSNVQKHPRRTMLAVVAAVLMLVGFSTSTHAQSQLPISGHMTADNFFMICHGNPLVCTSASDTWQNAVAVNLMATMPVSSTDHVYVVAWSDNDIAQGLLGELNGVPTGLSEWEVHPADSDRVTLANAPTTSQVDAEIAVANATNSWFPVIGGPNNDGSGLYWSAIATIASSAQWIWFDSGNDPSPNAPLENGFNHREYLIFRIPVSALICEQICGLKFHDINGDGIHNADEPGLPNWQIVLADQNGSAQIVTTDAAGRFAFSGVVPGTYTVYEIAQPGWTQTAPASGAHTITITSGQVINNLAFGNHLCSNGDIDLTIEKSLNVTSLQVGGTATYSLKVGNVGSSSTIGPVTVIDLLPLGLTPLSVAAPLGWNCSIAGSLVNCDYTGTPLAAGSSLLIDIPVQVDSQAVPYVNNCADVSTQADVKSANNQACVAADVTGGNAQVITDLGDAPGSINHTGAKMMAHPGIVSNYPTVYDVPNPATDPIGPIHHEPKAVAWLGADVSGEQDADLLADSDGITNIEPSIDAADRDWYDDGIRIESVNLPKCELTGFEYNINATVGAEMFVNVWFDFNRDGDWNDILTCNNKGDKLEVHEWAVQNQHIAFPVGLSTHATPAFAFMQPSGQDDSMWMRITLSESQPPQTQIVQPDGTTYLYADGRGPQNGYKYGETEDCLWPISAEQPRCWTMDNQTEPAP